jgi:acyl carrier protein
VTQADFEVSLCRFVRQLVADDSLRIRRNTRIFEEGLIDSLKVLDLIAFVEAELGIRISDADIRLEHFRTIQAISESFWKERRHAARAQAN